jgi:hypothetical protein
MEEVSAAGFYFDPEILAPFDAAQRNSTETVRTPLFFPPSQFGDLAASFSDRTFSSSFDELQIMAFGSASYSHGARPSPPAPEPALAEAAHTVSGRVESEQVSQFWRLYNAYPLYLKNVKKRARRKTRKGSGAISPT